MQSNKKPIIHPYWDRVEQGATTMRQAERGLKGVAREAVGEAEVGEAGGSGVEVHGSDAGEGDVGGVGEDRPWEAAEVVAVVSSWEIISHAARGNETASEKRKGKWTGRRQKTPLASVTLFVTVFSQDVPVEWAWQVPTYLFFFDGGVSRGVFIVALPKTSGLIWLDDLTQRVQFVSFHTEILRLNWVKPGIPYLCKTLCFYNPRYFFKGVVGVWLITMGVNIYIQIDG